MEANLVLSKISKIPSPSFPHRKFSKLGMRFLKFLLLLYHPIQK